MASPQQQDDPSFEPGKTRRQKTVDFAYLHEAEDDAAYAPIDERYAQSAYEDNLLKPVGVGRSVASNEQKSSEENPEIYAEEAEPTVPPQTSRAMQNMVRARLAKKMASTLATTGGRVRASAINAEAFSWQVPLWLFVQVPFAILGIITLALVATMDNIQAGANEASGIQWLVNKAWEAAYALAQLFGYDFMEIAMNIYLLSTVIILALGMFSIAFLFLQYKIGFLEPLGGEGAGLKHGLLLLTIIGYSVPIANLFPFIFLWMAAIWYHPR